MPKRPLGYDAAVLLYRLPALRPVLDALIVQGFHLGPDLYQTMLGLAGE